MSLHPNKQNVKVMTKFLPRSPKLNEVTGVEISCNLMHEPLFYSQYFNFFCIFLFPAKNNLYRFFSFFPSSFPTLSRILTVIMLCRLLLRDDKGKSVNHPDIEALSSCYHTHADKSCVSLIHFTCFPNFPFPFFFLYMCIYKRKKNLK